MSGKQANKDEATYQTKDYAFVASMMDALDKPDLSSMFHPVLAKIMESEAKSHFISIGGMISVVLVLTACFSPHTIVMGVGSMVHLQLFWILNVGWSGVNKTGIHTLILQIFDKVVKALLALRKDAATCIKNNLRVVLESIAVLDQTATIEATIQKLTENYNLLRGDDEFSKM
jgi:hypothetical protein